MSKLHVSITEVDSSPDCEYGCWTTGHGVEVYKEGELLYEQEAWAYCLGCSSIDWKELFDAIITEQKKGNVTVELGEDPYNNYPQWFLDALM